MRFDIGSVHSLAKQAIDRMYDMCEKFDDELNSFSERQLVHEIGAAL